MNVEIHVSSIGTYLLQLAIRDTTYGDFTQIIITPNAPPPPGVDIDDLIDLPGYDHAARLFNLFGTQNLSVHFIISICHNLPPRESINIDFATFAIDFP